MELVRVQDSDYQKTYELYMSFPENENGYMNNVFGYSYEQFLEWIEKKRKFREPLLIRWVSSRVSSEDNAAFMRCVDLLVGLIEKYADRILNVILW